MGLRSCRDVTGDTGLFVKRPEEILAGIASCVLCRWAANFPRSISTVGAPLPPVDSTPYDSAIAAGRTQLGETAFKAIRASASGRPFQEVVEGILENKQGYS